MDRERLRQDGEPRPSGDQARPMIQFPARPANRRITGSLIGGHRVQPRHISRPGFFMRAEQNFCAVGRPGERPIDRDPSSPRYQELDRSRFNVQHVDAFHGVGRILVHPDSSLEGDPPAVGRPRAGFPGEGSRRRCSTVALVTPSAARVRFEPSESTTYSAQNSSYGSQPRNASRVPSGDQAGGSATGRIPGAMLRASEPSTAIVCRIPSSRKAMRAPSGDHAGSYCVPLSAPPPAAARPGVTRRSSPLSSPTVTMSSPRGRTACRKWRMRRCRRPGRSPVTCRTPLGSHVGSHATVRRQAGHRSIPVHDRRRWTGSARSGPFHPGESSRGCRRTVAGPRPTRTRSRRRLRHAPRQGRDGRPGPPATAALGGAVPNPSSRSCSRARPRPRAHDAEDDYAHDSEKYQAAANPERLLSDSERTMRPALSACRVGTAGTACTLPSKIRFAPRRVSRRPACARRRAGAGRGIMRGNRQPARRRRRAM